MTRDDDGSQTESARDESSGDESSGHESSGDESGGTGKSGGKHSSEGALCVDDHEPPRERQWEEWTEVRTIVNKWPSTSMKKHFNVAAKDKEHEDSKLVVAIAAMSKDGRGHEH
jgi:hypothetical protein